MYVRTSQQQALLDRLTNQIAEVGSKPHTEATLYGSESNYPEQEKTNNKTSLTQISLEVKLMVAIRISATHVVTVILKCMSY